MENIDSSSRQPAIPHDLLEVTPCNIQNFNSAAYRKISLTKSQQAQINAMVSQLPLLAASDTIAHAYVMKFPKGVQHTLMKCHDGVNNTLINSEGKAVMQLPLYSLTPTAIMTAAFSALSMATCQYFLTEIHEQLTMLNKQITEVIELLYDDKKAELLAEMKFIQYTCENFNSIMAHDAQKTATLVGVQNAKRTAAKNIEFYISSLNKKSSDALTTKDKTKFEQLFRHSVNLNSSLTLSLQLYLISGIMETYYAENGDHDYIEYVRKDLLDYIGRYDDYALEVFANLDGAVKQLRHGKLLGAKDVAPIEADIARIKTANKSTAAAMRQAVESLEASNTRQYYVTAAGEVYLPCA